MKIVSIPSAFPNIVSNEDICAANCTDLALFNSNGSTNIAQIDSPNMKVGSLIQRDTTVMLVLQKCFVRG